MDKDKRNHMGLYARDMRYQKYPDISVRNELSTVYDIIIK